MFPTIITILSYFQSSCQGDIGKSFLSSKQNHQETCTAPLDCGADDKMSSSHPSSALVLYDPPSFLEPFQQKRRTFKLSGQVVHIHQKWNELGVAAVVWDAAIVLSEYLEQEVLTGRLKINDKTIIELGAGTGLVSMAVALLGGYVISTDRQQALSILEENIKANLDGPLESARGAVTVKKLDWEESAQEFNNTFDLILGADIIYIEETFSKLLSTIKALSSNSSKVILSCRIRYDRDTRFLTMLGEFFTVSKVYTDEARGIDIYEAISVDTVAND